jgi:hypothetical protein
MFTFRSAAGLCDWDKERRTAGPASADGVGCWEAERVAVVRRESAVEPLGCSNSLCIVEAGCRTRFVTPMPVTSASGPGPTARYRCPVPAAGRLMACRSHGELVGAALIRLVGKRFESDSLTWPKGSTWCWR